MRSDDIYSFSGGSVYNLGFPYRVRDASYGQQLLEEIYTFVVSFYVPTTPGQTSMCWYVKLPFLNLQKGQSNVSASADRVGY